MSNQRKEMSQMSISGGAGTEREWSGDGVKDKDEIIGIHPGDKEKEWVPYTQRNIRSVSR